MNLREHPMTMFLWMAHITSKVVVVRVDMNIIMDVTMVTTVVTVMAIGLIRTLPSWVINPLWYHPLRHLRCRLRRRRHLHPRFHPFMVHHHHHLLLFITEILSCQPVTPFPSICCPYLQSVILHLFHHLLSPCPLRLRATLPKHPYRNSGEVSGPCHPLLS